MGGKIERRIAIAGIEAVVAVDDAAVFADAERPWPTYASRGGAPDILVEVVTDPEFHGEPSARPPGFTVEPRGPTETHFLREDCHGVVTTGDGLLTARFRGQPRPVVVEAALRIAFAIALPRHGGLLLHSSGVAYGERGLLFLGPSGAGKSTIERLARASARPPRSLGDELTIARGARAYATPFAGENGPAERADAELASLVFLEKAPSHRARRLRPAEALPRLLRNVVAFVTDGEGAARTLAVAADLAERVPAHVLEFARQSDVADVLAQL